MNSPVATAGASAKSEEEYAAERTKEQAKTVRDLLDECETNLRKQLVKLQESREMAEKLNLMEVRRAEVYQVLYFDSPF